MQRPVVKNRAYARQDKWRLTARHLCTDTSIARRAHDDDLQLSVHRCREVDQEIMDREGKQHFSVLIVVMTVVMTSI